MRKYWMGIGAGLLSVSMAWAVDETVDGNLTVTGYATVGTVAATSAPGLGMQYIDGTNSSIQFIAPSGGTSWAWQYRVGLTTVPQMSLDTDNILTIYDRTTPAPVASIVLDPVGTSSFVGSLFVYGDDNRLPNQTIADGSSILTQDLADGRYAMNTDFGTHAVTDPTYGPGFGYSVGSGTASGYGSFANFGATASGPFSVALGVSSVASSPGAVSLGYGSAAAGYHSVAVGPLSTVTGGSAVSIGASSFASGDYSATLGAYSTASNLGSIALGYDSTASGYHATTAGANTVAQGSYQLVAGRFNVPQGDATSWVATDDLVQIGNGTDDTHRSNAFTIKKNGDVIVGGALHGLGGLHVFTSSGTFTVPDGITAVEVQMVGGGGGSANSSPSGGSGGYTLKQIFGLTPGAAITVTVGTAGTAGTGSANGGTGGTSSFGSYCSASGGGGTTYGAAGGTGGVGSGGDLNIDGQAGGDGVGTASMLGGGTRNEGGKYGGGAGTAGSGHDGYHGGDGVVIVRW